MNTGRLSCHGGLDTACHAAAQAGTLAAEAASDIAASAAPGRRIAAAEMSAAAGSAATPATPATALPLPAVMESMPLAGCRIRLDADRLPPSGMRTLLNLQGHSIAVFATPDGWRAIADSCPHQGASLMGGKVQDGAVQCPAHGLRFDLATGCLRQAPGVKVAVYPITTGPEGIYLELPGQD